MIQPEMQIVKINSTKLRKFAGMTNDLLALQIEGYYADPEADCQAFHICANDSSEGKLK